MEYRILGIDPGSRVAGWGLLDVVDGKTHRVRLGTIDVEKLAGFDARLMEMGRQLKRLLEEFRPQICVVEKVFLGRNVDSAFKLGHARGICFYEAKLLGSEIVEYSTKEVKKGITGNGAATKDQVKLILSRLLKFDIECKTDATDALALAYHHLGREWIRERTTF